MLSVLLLILKIIGIILLAILGIVLLVLLVPIFYRIEIEYVDKQFSVKVKAHWLKVVLNFFLQYEKELSYRLKVFCIKAVKSESYKEEEEKHNDEEKSEQSSSHDDSQEPAIDNSINEKPAEVADTVSSSVAETEIQLEDEPQTEQVHEDKKARKARKKEEKAARKARKQEEKAANKERKQEEKAKKKEEKARKKEAGDTFWGRIKSNKYVKIVRDDSFKPAKTLTLKLLKKTLKHILPRHIKGHIIVGINNPVLLGEMYGFISLVFGPRGKWLHKLDVIPDFVNQGAEVEARLKGRVTLGVLLYYFLRLYFDKDVRRLKRIYDGKPVEENPKNKKENKNANINNKKEKDN